MCVVDDDGRLVAVPARIREADQEFLRVELAAAAVAAIFDQRPGCVVADSFESYDAIRGVIVRGSVTHGTRLITLTNARLSSFSFGDRGLPDRGGTEQR